MSIKQIMVIRYSRTPKRGALIFGNGHRPRAALRLPWANCRHPLRGCFRARQGGPIQGDGKPSHSKDAARPVHGGLSGTHTGTHTGTITEARQGGPIQGDGKPSHSKDAARPVRGSLSGTHAGTHTGTIIRAQQILICRRYIALLEVLIAFVLIVLCVIPLIYPHIAILKAEKEFIAEVELDHLVNLLYANRLQKLYLNEIPWADIENSKEFPIDKDLLQSVGYTKELPFIGAYRFNEIKHKPPKQPEDAVYLFKLSFIFIPKWAQKQGWMPEGQQKHLKYEYDIAIERKGK